MQALALESAKRKAGLHDADLDALFSGDLLNQCISSSFAVRDTGVPFFGLYGACSTMAEGPDSLRHGRQRRLCPDRRGHELLPLRVGGAAVPLSSGLYGGQRTPTAQWTVTGAGCMLLGQRDRGPCLRCATVGTVVDYGIKDAANMGAAMAPAAYATLRAHFDDLGRSPEDYDCIVTGDLGAVGKAILLDLFRRDGVALDAVYDDCGVMIFDLERQGRPRRGLRLRLRQRGSSAATSCGVFRRGS